MVFALIIDYVHIIGGMITADATRWLRYGISLELYIQLYICTVLG